MEVDWWGMGSMEEFLKNGNFLKHKTKETLVLWPYMAAKSQNNRRQVKCWDTRACESEDEKWPYRSL